MIRRSTKRNPAELEGIITGVLIVVCPCRKPFLNAPRAIKSIECVLLVFSTAK